MQTHRIGAEQFRRQLADLLNQVSYRGDQVIVERHGSPQAVLIPYPLYERVADLLEKTLAPAQSEDEFERTLVEAGLLHARQTAPPDPPTRPHHTLVAIPGKPLSQIIIEERR